MGVSPEELDARLNAWFGDPGGEISQSIPIQTKPTLEEISRRVIEQEAPEGTFITNWTGWLALWNTGMFKFFGASLAHTLTYINNVRGEVQWNTDTLFNFLVGRSSGSILQDETPTPSLTTLINDHTDLQLAGLVETNLPGVVTAVNDHTDDAVVTLQGDLNDRRDQIIEADFDTDQKVARILSGHHDLDLTAELPAEWSIPADVNAHTTNVGDLILTAISGAQLVLDTIGATIAAVEGWLNSIRDEINAHTTTQREVVTDAIGQAVTDVNTHTTTERDVVTGAITTAVTDVGTRIGTAETTINTNTDAGVAQLQADLTDTQSAINTHTTAERDEVLSALAGLTIPGPLDVASIIGPINTHTTSTATALQTAVGVRIGTAETTIGSGITAAALPIAEAQTAMQARGTSIAGLLGLLLTAIDTITTIFDLVNIFDRWNGGNFPRGGTPSLEDETAWDTQIRYLVPADFYEIQIDAYGAKQQRVDVPGGDWLPRIGWVSLVTGYGFSERSYIEFNSRIVPVHDVDATGLLIYCQPGTSGIVRAYRYT